MTGDFNAFDTVAYANVIATSLGVSSSNVNSTKSLSSKRAAQGLWFSCCVVFYWHIFQLSLWLPPLKWRIAMAWAIHNSPPTLLVHSTLPPWTHSLRTATLQLVLQLSLLHTTRQSVQQESMLHHITTMVITHVVWFLGLELDSVLEFLLLL